MFGRVGFLARRWRGEVPLPVLFWRDIVGIGTFINLLASVMALIPASQGVDLRVAVALHFAPIAYIPPCSRRRRMPSGSRRHCAAPRNLLGAVPRRSSPKRLAKPEGVVRQCAGLVLILPTSFLRHTSHNACRILAHGDFYQGHPDVGCSPAPSAWHGRSGAAHS